MAANFQIFHMGKFLLISFILLFGFTSFSQEEIFISIHLQDVETETPVKNARIDVKNNSKHFQERTDFEGDAMVQMEKKYLTQTKFFVSHAYYGDTIIPFNKSWEKRKEGDTIYVSFSLNFDGQSVEGVEFSANQLPEEVFASERVSVADFELLNDGNLILLAYEKRLKKGSVIYLYDGEKVISTFKVPGYAQELVRDFRGNIHVICKEKMFTLVYSNLELKIARIEKDYFFKYVAPIVDTVSTKLFFSNYNEFYPAFEYFSYDKEDSVYTKLLNIEDELMMELYRSEYKWVDVKTKLWARDMEDATGIDRQVWVGANYFTQSIYYEELYAPMFKRNDTVMVFDHYRELAYQFDGTNGNALVSIPIFYHLNKKKTGWKKELIQDQTTGQVYSIYDRAGFTYVALIDPKNAKPHTEFRLHFRYVEKMEIRDNKIYYIYRPFESLQKKYVYSERLPYSFPEADVPQGDDNSITNATGK